MNERYQELVRLAVEDAAKYSKRRFDITIEENETFALCLTELIVRECANVAADHDAIDIYEEIREHFGVEE
jgi:hypothetical protein